VKPHQKDGVGIPDAMGRMQDTNIISEAGLYRLIMRSHVPQAEEFQDWVADEVLPQIRKHGAYVHSDPELDDSEIMARGLMAAQRAIKRRDQLIHDQKKQITTMKPIVETWNQVRVRR
jgi:anti-repressor protein